MAIDVDWITGVISIPKADLQVIQLMPTEIYQLDLVQFHQDLRTAQADEPGAPYSRTHNHNLPVTVGGVTLADVVEILAPYTVTFEDGQYAVNLVGANSNVLDVVNFNQVSVRSANSAGLTFSDQINDQSFQDGAVWLDVVNGLPGTEFPGGTTTNPVDNIADAITIANDNKLTRIFLSGGSVTLPAALEGFEVIGRTEDAGVSFNGQDVTGSRFEGVTLDGAMGDGPVRASNSTIDGVTNLTGTFFDCSLTINGVGLGGDARFIRSFSAVPGVSTPAVDFTGASAWGIEFRGHIGGLEIQNLTDATTNLSLDALSAHIRFAASCTNANSIALRGLGKFTDLASFPAGVVDNLGFDEQIGGVT